MLRSHSLRWLALASFPFLAACLAQAQVKVAVINSQSALLDTAELKKAQADLEAKYKPRQEQIAKAQKELDGINQQLSLGDKLTPQAQAELTQQGQRKQRDLQRLTEDLQADVERERNEILARTSERMQKVVAKLAEDKGLDLVVEATSTLFVKPTIDISKEATAAYDKTFPVK